jgi:hypothetical protein
MTQDINYKVNVDTSDLSSQLQAAKSQIDATLAQQSFQASMPDMSSRMFAFPDMSSAHTEAANSIRSAMDTARLGFQKFNSDMQNLALMTPVTMPPLQSTPGTIPDFQGMSGARSAFESMTNWGYSPRMALSPGEYAFRARQSFGDKSLDFAGSVAGTLGWAGLFGTALKAAGVGGGLAALGPIGLVAGAAEIGYEVFGHDFQNANQSRMFARDTSWRFLSGRFNSSDASRIGLEASKLQRMDEVMGDRLSNSDVQTLQREYTEVGGFDYVRTAEEYRTKLKDLIANHTKVLQTLKTASKEASQAMAEWDWMGLTGTHITSTQFATTVAAQAYNAGYTPTEFLQFAKQSQEMIRGTGIGFGSAYVGGMNALGIVKDVMQNGNIPGQAVMHLGGAENAAATITRTGYNFGMSQAGLTYLAAEAYYGSNANVAEMSVNNILGGAFNKLNSPLEYLEFKGGISDVLSKKDPTELYLMQANAFAQEMTKLHIPITQNKWRSYLGSNYGMSTPQADLMYGVMTSPNQNTGELYSRMALEYTNQHATPWDVAMDKLGRSTANMLGLESWGKGFERIRGGLASTSGGISRWYRGLSSDVELLDASAVQDRGILSVQDIAKYGIWGGTKTSDVQFHTRAARDYIEYANTESASQIFQQRQFVKERYGLDLPNLWMNTKSIEDLLVESDKFFDEKLSQGGPKSKALQNTFGGNRNAQRALYIGGVSGGGGDSSLNIGTGGFKKSLDNIDAAVEKIIQKRLPNTASLFSSNLTPLGYSPISLNILPSDELIYTKLFGRSAASMVGYETNDETGLSGNMELFKQFSSAYSKDVLAQRNKDFNNRGQAAFIEDYNKRSGTTQGTGVWNDLRVYATSEEGKRNIATQVIAGIGMNATINENLQKTILDQFSQLSGFSASDKANFASSLNNPTTAANAILSVVTNFKNDPKLENALWTIRANTPNLTPNPKSLAAATQLQDVFSNEGTTNLARSLDQINAYKEGIKTLLPEDMKDNKNSQTEVLQYINSQSLKNTENNTARLAATIHPTINAQRVFIVNPN